MKIIENPDKDFVKELKRELKANAGYCPCTVEQTKDTKCICKAFREQDEGMCTCGLYIKIPEEGAKEYV